MFSKRMIMRIHSKVRSKGILPQVKDEEPGEDNYSKEAGERVRIVVYNVYSTRQLEVP
jgi:hypothetical protein